MQISQGIVRPALLALGSMAAFQALAHETRDHKEAVDAFTEKRTPKFTGE